MSKIRNKKRKPIDSLDFDITRLRTEHEKQYLFEHLPEVIYKLLDSINFNTEKWLVSFGAGCLRASMNSTMTDS